MKNKINLHGFRAEHAKDCYEYYNGLISHDSEIADTLRQTLLRRWEKAHERLRTENMTAWYRQRKRFVSDMDDRPYFLRGDNAAKAFAMCLPIEYNRLAMMCVSVLHLSHWRLDVTVINYLIR